MPHLRRDWRAWGVEEVTWLTALLIAWAAATLGLLVGALMCAAGRSDS